MRHRPHRTALTLLGTTLLLLSSSPAWSQTPVYVFSGTRFQRLGAPLGPAGDVDGDGIGDLVIGATPAGSVLLHSGADGSVLRTIVGNPGESFGSAAANAGDVNDDGYPDLVVGAPLSDANGSLSGAVTVYSGLDGQLLQTHAGVTLDLFGTSIVGAGDVDLDGFADFAVGAPVFLGDAGHVVLFSGKDGNAIRTLTSTISRFGQALASAGDLDADGIADLLVGGPGDDRKGSVSAISLATGTTLFKAMGTEVRDDFGIAVDGGGDVNGDHVPDFIAGAPQWPGAGSAAYARVCSGVDGSLLYKLEGDAKDNISDLYAASVAHAGDANGDGVDDFQVGASVEDKSHLNAGRAWLYSGKTGALLYAFDGEYPGEELGTALAFVPDLDGDGRAEALIGAPLEDHSGANAGRAFVFAGNDLYHLAQPHAVSAGETLTHATSGGPANAPTILVITEVSGTPTFLLVGGLAFLDATGRRAFSVVVPAGLSGLAITHRAFALNAQGFVIDSASEVVTFL